MHVIGNSRKFLLQKPDVATDVLLSRADREGEIKAYVVSPAIVEQQRGFLSTTEKAFP
jgi:hypothetical protein